MAAPLATVLMEEWRLPALLFEEIPLRRRKSAEMLRALLETKARLESMH